MSGPAAATRVATAAVLEDLLATARARLQLPATPATPDRERLHQQILDAFDHVAATTPSLRRDGRAFIAFAPPGTDARGLLAGQGEVPGSLSIDVEQIAGLLLRDDVWTGRLNRLLGRGLPDGRPVRAMEAFTLVRPEAEHLAELMWGRALAGRCNVAAGACRPGQVTALAAAGYDRLDLIVADAPLPDARRQARDRWWAGRGDLTTWAGAPFTPTAAITACYPVRAGPHGLCLRESTAIFQSLEAAGLGTVTLTVHSSHPGDPATRRLQRDNHR